MTEKNFHELHLRLLEWIKIGWNYICHNAVLITVIVNLCAFIVLIGQTRLLENQVFVSNSLSVFQIGDRCIWYYMPHYGDYDSYLLLKAMKADPINKEMIKAINNQIERVEDRYRSTDVMIAYASRLQAIIFMNKDGSGELADKDTIDVQYIFSHMKRHLPVEQIKASYFMSSVTTERLEQSGKTWEDVFKILIWAINNDAWCLYGRKMALMSYCKLAETKFPGVFDFERATKDWQNRKQEILKKKKGPLTNQPTGSDSLPSES